MAWLEKKLPESWASKVIVCHDKSLLSADYLIDVAPNPFECYDLFKRRGSNQFSKPVALRQVPWKLILVDRPFNAHVKHSPETPWFHGRFSVWKQWTQPFANVLDLSFRDTIVSYAHGSTNSLDEDRMYIFPHALINTVVGDQARAILDDGIIDVNLMDLDEDGYICDNHKGQNDEIHNALQTTYPLHAQRFPLPPNFGDKVQRAVALKYLTGMRRIFIRLTEVESTREFCKATLRNHDPSIGPKAFAELDFATILPLTNVDHAKTFAFQMGQIVGLFDGLDLFTKDDIARAYPTLEPFIRRNREESLQKAGLMDDFRTDMLRRAKAVTIHPGARQVGLLQLSTDFLTSPEVENVESWNALLEQSNGMVIDFKDLSIVAFPPSHTTSSVRRLTALAQGKSREDAESPQLIPLPKSLDWPRDPIVSTENAILPPSTAVSVGQESHGHLVVSDTTGFDSPSCTKAQAWLTRECNEQQIDQWPWRSRYFFFDIDRENENSFVLVASRSKFSHLFLSKERLEVLGKEMGVKAGV